jgi:hypothetical protein
MPKPVTIAISAPLVAKKSCRYFINRLALGVVSFGSRGFKDLFPIPVSYHHALEEWKACVCRRGLLFKLIFYDRNPSEIASMLGRVSNQKSIVTWVTTFRP